MKKENKKLTGCKVTLQALLPSWTGTIAWGGTGRPAGYGAACAGDGLAGQVDILEVVSSARQQGDVRLYRELTLGVDLV